MDALVCPTVGVTEIDAFASGYSAPCVHREKYGVTESLHLDLEAERYRTAGPSTAGRATAPARRARHHDLLAGCKQSQMNCGPGAVGYAPVRASTSAATPAASAAPIRWKISRAQARLLGGAAGSQGAAAQAGQRIGLIP